MKISLSKTQWEQIGKTAGWMKTSELSENIVPVEEIIGTTPVGKTLDEIDEEMHSKGYFLFREYYHFGKVPSYRNKKDDKVYLPIGWHEEGTPLKWVSWEQLKATLKELWRPVAQDEIGWFNENVDI